MTEKQKSDKKELESKKAKGDIEAHEQSYLDTLIALEKSENDLKKQEERMDGVQQKMSDWGREVGEMREAQKKLNETIENLQKNNFGKQTPPDRGGAGDDKDANQKADALLAEIMTHEKGAEILNAGWENLSSDQRKKLEVDAEFRLAYYQKAKSELGDAAPRKPWDTSGSKENGGKNETSLDDVFRKKDGRQPPKKETPSGKADEDKKDNPSVMYDESSMVRDSRTR